MGQSNIGSLSQPRSVLVTGGNRGIGKAVAQKLAQSGHQVAITSRGDCTLENIYTVKCDVTSAEQTETALKQVEEHQGAVEILVVNAGITKDTLIMRMSDEQFIDVLEVNLIAAFRFARLASKSMLRKRFGRIIFIGSVSSLMGAPGQANYSASKAGLIGLARSLTRELGSRNITANVVAPGFIETDMTAALEEKYISTIKGAIPMARLGQAEEVAGVVNWLASDDANYVSGAVIPVDGGLGMGH